MQKSQSKQINFELITFSSQLKMGFMQNINHLFKLSLALGLAFSLVSVAEARLFYQKNQSPNEVRQDARLFQNYFGYSNKNNLHPYSTFQNPYEPGSARNNVERYSARVWLRGGKEPFGYLNSQTNQAKGLNNPYSEQGNGYNPNRPYAPYSQHRFNNPYNQFQSAYDPRSARNSPSYDIQYKDGFGNPINGNQTTYDHSPYNYNSLQNPYGPNRFRY